MIRCSHIAWLIVGLGLVTGCSLDAPSPNTPAPTQQSPVATAPQPVGDESLSKEPLSVQDVAPVQQRQLRDPDDPREFAPLNAVRLAFIWYDLPLLQGQDFVGTRVLLSKQGTATQMSFTLPPINTTCDGTIRFLPKAANGLIGGDWEITCSNNRTIRGILVPVAGQRAINGQGQDDQDRSVIFSIDINEEQ